GSSTSSQITSAQTNAQNWFFANFPSGVWGTSGTVMPAAVVADDPVNPRVRNVRVSASTNVPAYFMRLLNFNTTSISAIGNAARRDVVVMLVLDRSGSMNSNNGCANMINASKIFTGQFAAGRDQIGMVTFGETISMAAAPSNTFQTTLGYSNASGTGSGLIDTIVCNGWTGTPGAMSVGYNELFKTNLPGALNIVMFMTDGLPNVVVANYQTRMKTNSLCKDSAGVAISGGGNMSANPRAWYPSVALGGLFGTIPAGPIGAIGEGFGVNRWYSATNNPSTYSQGTATTTAAPGCAFPSNTANFTSDISGFPENDIFGNSLSGYRAINRVTSGAYTGQIRADQATNTDDISFNTSDAAATQARTNTTVQAYVFGVGLGGTTGTPPDYRLMQRMTNDPNADLYNTPALYGAYSNIPTQPVGTFIYASNPGQLNSAFLKISSMILRLSQ
ncbi:MAG: vWA domain-containing protein, partial [Bryobacteraceae bacterium]